MELLREVMVCMFIWVSKSKKINATTEEHVSLQTDEAKQVFHFPPFCLLLSFTMRVLKTTCFSISHPLSLFLEQFIMDVQFLVEIGMYGGYFSTDPLLLLTVMKSTFNSAGLDPFK